MNILCIFLYLYFLGDEKGKPFNIAGKRIGIDWLRKNVKNGVMYIAEDHNTYHRDLFEEVGSSIAQRMLFFKFFVGLILTHY